MSEVFRDTFMPAASRSSCLRCVLSCVLLCALVAVAQAPVERRAPPADTPPPPSLRNQPGFAPQDEVPAYTQDVFVKPVDPSQLAFLRQFSGRTTNDLLHDKVAKKMLWSFIPKCEFHYGRDMPLQDAFDLATGHSHDTVGIVDDRYLIVMGEEGAYLSGRAALWVDLKQGIGLGAFFFTPTNGEPTPSLVVFSSQVQEPAIHLSQLPPAFAAFLVEWSARRLIAPITPRYFIGNTRKRLLLEHDEDFCAPYGRLPAAHPACDQANADAADVDLTSAFYLDKIHYATNGTAWMLGPEQTAWFGVRDRSCGGVADGLACRIRITREHTRVILQQPPHRPRR